MEARDLAWVDANHIPADTVVEVRTRTATVFEDCAPTDTVFTTVTVFEDLPAEPTDSEPTTTVHITRTVTKTTTDIVAVMAEPTSGNTSQSSAETVLPHHAPNILPTALPLRPQLVPGPKTAQFTSIAGASEPDEPSPSSQLSTDWTSVPADGAFSTNGFGGRTSPRGTQVQYRGNVGVPWGSNIIAVSAADAPRYKYIAQFRGSNTEPWTVTMWNKDGPDGKMNGWYGHAALTFMLAPGETRYVAFDEDSEGAWGAAPGGDAGAGARHGLPTDNWGGYACTWGEFSFGDIEDGGWSGWDVSAIQAQAAGQPVQGMRVCEAAGPGCSSITPGAGRVINAYTKSKRAHDGIGGAAPPGPVRLAVHIDYRG